MIINSLKDLQRLNKSYEYMQLIQFGANCDIKFYYGSTFEWYGNKSVKKLVATWRKIFNISRKEYIVLIVDDDMYQRMQYYTHSYVYTVQELFRKEKVIIEKSRSDTNLFVLLDNKATV